MTTSRIDVNDGGRAAFVAFSFVTAATLVVGALVLYGLDRLARFVE